MLFSHVLTIISIATANALAARELPEGGCLSYGRGVGKIPKECPEGKSKQSGLCYKPCKKGWKGVGPVCWAGWKGKGRGAGTIPNQCGPGRENKAGLCYKNCDEGFHGIGPVCWQNSC